MPYVLILGAKSDIAQALAEEYAARQYHIILASRSTETCKPLAQHLKVKYQIQVDNLFLDIEDFESHQTFVKDLIELPYGVISAIGYLGDQKDAEVSGAETLKIMNANATGPIHLLNLLANEFENRATGFIIGISSVAGDRGRQSNYLYGSVC